MRSEADLLLVDVEAHFTTHWHYPHQHNRAQHHTAQSTTTTSVRAQRLLLLLVTTAALWPDPTRTTSARRLRQIRAKLPRCLVCLSAARVAALTNAKQIQSGRMNHECNAPCSLGSILIRNICVMDVVLKLRWLIRIVISELITPKRINKSFAVCRLAQKLHERAEGDWWGQRVRRRRQWRDPLSIRVIFMHAAHQTSELWPWGETRWCRELQTIRNLVFRKKWWEQEGVGTNWRTLGVSWLF